MIIGLTGGIGSGKTTVANMFVKLGIDIVDADVVARQVVEPGTKGLAEIVDHFGESILADDGTLDRAQLRSKVFSDETAKAWLNQLLHPLIREEIFAQLARAKSRYKILVAPLLIENGLTEQVARILVIDVTKDQQIERTLKRDGSSPDIINNIIAAQVSREERLSKADDIINNTSPSLLEVEQQVKALHQQYLLMATKA
ncbi:dephospho-CoA kinase [Thalassotalea euphylliae]|uniref:Dephospho-CoA kinase n=1 Tax=Thalassotalea euphylliae TaxID=1655234 RepID=A0A3E0TUD1_9GAMM|nr:dephospho-CoA kinase [Thalassotalea euphylliae]REL28060.1 dephospho-CoA kinase [Thalassotalea euphylliae]